MIPAANYLPAVDVRDGFLLFWLDIDNLFNWSTLVYNYYLLSFDG
jgi:hypothetical protein